MEEQVIQFFDTMDSDFPKFNEASIGQTLHMLFNQCSDFMVTERVMTSAKSMTQRYFKWARSNNVKIIGVRTIAEYEKVIETFFKQYGK